MAFPSVRAAVFHISMTQENHPTISRYTVSGTYHTATISRHARTKPPITPPIMKFNANRAIPPPREPQPGTIQRHIRWSPNGSPQSIQSHTQSSSPFFMQADLKIQYKISATITGSTLLKKNALIASLLVIGKTSFRSSIIQDAGSCAQRLSEKIIPVHAAAVVPVPLERSAVHLHSV